MIALLPLLLLALLDVPDAERRRATANELKNRLGLREEEALSDLRARLLWVQRTYRDPLVWREVLAIVHDDIDINDLWPRNEPDLDDVFEELLPASGVRSRSEKLVPWLARQADLTLQAWHASRPDEDRDRSRENEDDEDEDDRDPFPHDYDREDEDLSEFERLSPEGVLDWIEAGAPGSPVANPLVQGWRDVVRQSDAWHRELLHAAEERKRLGRTEPPPAGIPVATFPNGDRIERLETKDALDGEGLYLGHCVGGDSHYWPEVRDGKTAILSYRDPQGFPKATIEITLGESHSGGVSSRAGWTFQVQQVQGPGNSRITDPEIAANLAAFLFMFFLGGERVDLHRFDLKRAWRNLDLPLFLGKDDWKELVNDEEVLQESLDTEDAERESGDFLEEDLEGERHLCQNLFEAFATEVRKQIEWFSTLEPVRDGGFEMRFLFNEREYEEDPLESRGFTITVLPQDSGRGGTRFQVRHLPAPGLPPPTVKGSPHLLELLVHEGLLLKEKDFLARYREIGETITFVVPKEDVLLPHAAFLERRGLTLKKGRLVTR